MAGPFSITPSSNRVALNENGKGTVTFTVTNTARMRLRSAARLIATPPEAMPWLTLLAPEDQADAASRSFAPEATHSYPVQVAVPPTAAAGDYRLKLVVANEANPDDEFTESAEVGFTVAPQAPPPTPRRFPMWLIPVIVVLVLLGGVSAFLLTRDDPPADDPPIASPLEDLLLPQDAIEGAVEINSDTVRAGDTVQLFASRGSFVFNDEIDVTGTDSFGESCSGQVSKAPAFQVIVSDASVDTLTFFTNSGLRDSTLLVRDTAGRIHCGVATQGVSIVPAEPGDYFFWVSSQAADRRLRRLFPIDLGVSAQ